MQSCILCGTKQVIRQPKAGDFDSFSCGCCGQYSITGTAYNKIELTLDQEKRFKIACWAYGENQNGPPPKIDERTLAMIKVYPEPPVQKRIELYLGRLLSLAKGKLQAQIYSLCNELCVASWSDQVDAYGIFQHLIKQNIIEKMGGTDYALIGAHTYLVYEKMTDSRRLSSQGFVAMWFDDSMQEIYDKGMKLAITDAGYDDFRVDRSEHIGKIDDEIVAQIRRSAFIVADFTGHRGGVYYEAGYAHGLGRPTIFTCRKSDLAHLHFDVRQFNTIVWQDARDLKATLQNRILAALGAGPNNPDAQPVHMN